MTENTQRQNNELQPGTVINGYRIERELGRGAMAVVYLATQLDLGRPVAFKVLSAELAADGDFVSRFFNEARAAAALSHPNIIQAIDAGQTSDGLYFFCMEYVDGETLLDIIKRDGRIPVSNALKWFMQIADALNYGWELHKFTHGDIKPENIMINRQGQAKLADFGLARVDGHDYSGNVVMLTPLYAPPELIRGQRFVDECRPDIYAFGASLYHALAGTPPFPGTEAKVVIQRQLNEELEPLDHRCMAIPKKLSDFVGKMLVKEMNGRVGSWQAVMAGLKSSLAAVTKKPRGLVKDANARTKPIPPMPSVPKKRGNSNMMIVTFTVLGFCFLSIVLLLILNRPSRKTVPAVAEKPAPAVVDEEPASGKGRKGAAAASQPGTAVTEADRVKGAVENIRKLTAQGEDEEEETDSSNAQQADVAQNTDAEEEEEKDEKDENAQATVETDAEPSEEPEPDKADDARKGDKDTADQTLKLADYALPFGLSEDQEAFERTAELAFIWLDLTNSSNWWKNDWCKTGVQFNQRVKACQERLQAECDMVSDKAAAQFLANEVVGNLAKLPNALAKNGDTIGQLAFDIGNESWRVMDIGGLPLCSARVAVQTTGRKNQVSYSWMVLHEKGILTKICQQLIANGNRDFESDGPFLAYLALIGQSKALASSLAVFPENEQKASWQRLLAYESLRGTAKRERNAFGIWRGLCAASQSGGVCTAYEKAVELQKKYEQTEVYKTFRPVIDSLAERSRDRSQEARLENALQEQAAQRESGEADGKKQLMDAMFTTARYGKLLVNSEERKMERMVAKARKELSADAKNYGLGYAVPFVQTESPNVYIVMARTCLFANEQEGKSKGGDYVSHALTTLSRLDIGDWHDAYDNRKSLFSRELEKQEVQGHSKLSSALLHYAALYGRGLLCWRVEEEPEKADKQISLMLSDEDADDYAKAVAQELTMEYCLLRHGDESSSVFPEVCENVRTYLSYMRSTQELKRWSAAHRRRMTYMFMIAAMETGHDGEVNLLLRRLQDTSTAELCGFPENLPYMRTLLDDFEKFHSTPEEREKTGKYLTFFESSLPGEVLKLRLCAYGETPVNDKADAASKKKLAEFSQHCRLIAGEAVYDWVLRRVAFELQTGKMKNAEALCAWALDLRGSCMFPYYARLLSLRGGLLFLNGIAGGAMDASAQAETAECVSEGERKMLRAFSESPRRAMESHDGKMSSANAFWYGWLAATEQLGSDKNASDELQKLLKNRGKATLSERTLAIALQKFLETCRGAQPVELEEVTVQKTRVGTRGDDAEDKADNDDAEQETSSGKSRRRGGKRDRRRR